MLFKVATTSLFKTITLKLRGNINIANIDLQVVIIE